MKAIALALLALAATAAVLRRRRPAAVPQCDDSEIVGMPTAMGWGLSSPYISDAHERGWYVELAPTSRN